MNELYSKYYMKIKLLPDLVKSLLFKLKTCTISVFDDLYENDPLRPIIAQNKLRGHTLARHYYNRTYNARRIQQGVLHLEGIWLDKEILNKFIKDEIDTNSQVIISLLSSTTSNNKYEYNSKEIKDNDFRSNIIVYEKDNNIIYEYHKNIKRDIKSNSITKLVTKYGIRIVFFYKKNILYIKSAFPIIT